MRQIRFTLPAAAKLAAILDYIATRRLSGAQNVRRRIEAQLRLIAEMPEAGPTARNRAGMRRIFVIPYPYVIDYRITDDEIVIHNIRHTARRPRP